MLRHLAGRLLLTLPVLIGVLLVGFLPMHGAKAPGRDDIGGLAPRDGPGHERH